MADLPTSPPRSLGAYEAAIAAANAELVTLRESRAKIDKRIKHLTDTLATLFRLTLGEVPGNIIGMGLTDALRMALGVQYPLPLSSSGAVAALESAGYDLRNYKNKQASVNGTLQRLVDLGEVKRTTLKTPGGIRLQAYVLKVDPNAKKDEGQDK